MNRQYLKEAKERLRAMERGMESLNRLDELSDINTAWTNLIAAGDIIYEKLKLATRDTSFSDWYGKKIKQRRSDPLLNYLWQARNVEHHGGSSLTVLKFGPAYEPVPKDIAVRIKNILLLSDVDVNIAEHDDANDVMEMAYELDDGTVFVPKGKPRQAAIMLEKFSSRGVVYVPPTEHLGIKADFTVHNAAAAYVAFMKELLSEAVTLANKSA